ncbi:2'-5' RNA ligase family protein [Roseivirga sp. E12]|uniref:2'-5' RNA ligase family protein n=1 Tax=Roseivirga sp. E12 TaxID=2819237 RepID=UPI001ABC9C54|nr:2'-5' RNA ligase family protein [Roseivirga sp. E12]
MKRTEAKYFLAIIPSEPVQSQVQEIKEYFRDTYGSKGALRSPAHITLHMPFRWKEKKEGKLFDLLAQATKESKFELELNGYGAFSPKTMFIKNQQSQELIDFQKRLADFAKRHMNLFNATHNRGYHPHMTVAFRDLKKDAFLEAWDEFKEKDFNERLIVDSFWLLKHDGTRWNAYKEFQFS